MSLARLIGMMAGRNVMRGQQQWTTAGSYSFVVPGGVFEISAVVVGAGGSGSNSSPFTGGGGGGLHWRNSVQVFPGETLTVEVGEGAYTPPNGTTGGTSRLKRGSSILLEATGGTAVGSRGLGRFNIYGGGGGDGGNTATSGLGGGAAGYVGNGGRGGDIFDQAGGYPDANSGGGRGGNRESPGNAWDSDNGEGVGLQGRTPDFAYSSLGLPKVGAGGPNVALGAGPQSGGVRIMWGLGRSYPDNAADV